MKKDGIKLEKTKDFYKPIEKIAINFTVNSTEDESEKL